MIKRLLSSVVALAMVASIGFVSQVSAKEVTTTLISGVTNAGSDSKAVDDYSLTVARMGQTTFSSDGSQIVVTSGADYDVAVAGDNCGNNYVRSYINGNVTTETHEGSVYYEWTVNFSAAPAFIGIYNKDSEGAWGKYPGRINYRVGAKDSQGNPKPENHLWNTGLGGIIPINQDCRIGFLYDVLEGTWVLYIDGKASKKTGAVNDPDLGIGQCWLEVSMVGATDTMTIKDMSMYNTVTVEKEKDALLSGLPLIGYSKTEGGVSIDTAIPSTASVVNKFGTFYISGDCSTSTASYSRVYLNTTEKTTGYLWYQYTVNMNEIPSLIAINAKSSEPNSVWQYGENLTYSKTNGENHLLRTTGAAIVPGQDYTFGFLVNLDDKTYTITQNGEGTRISGKLYAPSANVGQVWFETQMNSATGVLTMKDVSVKYFPSSGDTTDALYEGIPLLSMAKDMNGINMYAMATGPKGATVSNPFKSFNITAAHLEDNSNFARIYVNGIVNDSRNDGLYLTEFTVKASSAPRDLGFFSRANGNYPLTVHIMTANSDEDYATMRTTGEQYVPNKEYKFGLLYNAKTGEYRVYENDQPTKVAGKVDMFDGEVRTMGDLFFEVQTLTDKDSVEVSAIKVSEVKDMEFNKATFESVDGAINATLNVSNAMVVLAGFDAEGKFVGYSSTSSFGPKTLTIPGAVDAKVLFLTDIESLTPIAPAQSYTK